MYLCSENHDEICHENRDCPLCQALETVEDLTKEIEANNEEIRDLEVEIEDLKER